MRLPHHWEHVLHNFGEYIEGLWKYELCRYACIKSYGSVAKIKIPTLVFAGTLCLYLPRKRNLGKLYWRYYRSQFFPLPTMCHTVCKLYIITKAHFLYVKCIVVQESFMLCLEIQNWNAITPSCGPHSYVLVKSDQFYKKWSDLIINQRKYMKAFLHFCIEFWSTNSSGSDCFENWHRDIKII